MNKIKPLNTEEIKALFDRLGEIEGFDEIKTLGFDTSVFRFMMKGKIYQLFLVRVIEAVNKLGYNDYNYPIIHIIFTEKGYDFAIGTADSDLWREWKDYPKIDDCKTAVIRKYLEMN